MDKIGYALFDIQTEVTRAKALHPGDFHNAHEALAVIREEYVEFEQEVFKNKKTYSKEKAKEEAVQIAAMCVRFITELT